ncbi:MAG: metallophosphoesterase [Bacteroidia bacterium]
MKKFTPQKMVGWYDAKQLFTTAIRAVLSSIFGSYADKRETIASITEEEVYNDYNTNEEIWVDYISDTGDGFDSTFTMAKLISYDEITVNQNNQEKILPRGKILVFGGDQVYPSPTREEYQNRFIGPMEAASPYDDDKAGADMYVVPGNHDWYDGLTNFAKIFCRKKKIGSFQTKQNRSYFAIKVRNNVWLWAIDIQLESDIDKPQLDYFNHVASEHMQKGDKIILCTAEPSWVYNTTRRVDKTYENLEYFEENCIKAKGMEQILTLTGDLHHYARYTAESEEGKVYHKITSGGGGAFLHPTHNLPDQLKEMHDGEFVLKKTFPEKKTSKRLIWGNLLFPIKNLSFGAFLAAVHLAMAWSLKTTSELDEDEADIFVQMRTMYEKNDFDFSSLLNRLITTFGHSFSAVLILGLFVLGFYKFCDSNSSKYKHIGFLGMFHGILHVVLMLFSLCIFTFVGISFLGLEPGRENVAGVIVQQLLFGGLLSGMLIGLYFIFTNLVLGIHDNEAFSALKNKDYKNFLRMHFKGNTLTIYPVGLRKTAKWTQPYIDKFETKDTIIPELIDDPIVIEL